MKIWIEKTIVNKRPDRISGDRALGKVLWSPSKSKDGKDIYKNMRLVRKGDLVMHFVDDEEFQGVSIVAKKASEGVGLVGSKWEGNAYLVNLKDFKKLDPTLHRREFLNEERFSSRLNKIRENGEVFYNKNFTLRQGAYLTPCSLELYNLLNEIYTSKTKRNLPYFEMIDFNKEIRPNEKLPILNSFESDIEKSGIIFPRDILLRFLGSQFTKPFVILTGVSGSGKTKLAQAFALWICNDESQYKLVPVGADWTNREPLLGYPNGLDKSEYVMPDTGVLDLLIEASKEENRDKPYFLILDEMNLSHVERYFADFLSAMESVDTIKLYDGANRTSTDGKDIPKVISIPKNLFVIGTVNIDETTYMFSPKVLDRASVIEFRVSKEEMDNYLNENLPVKLDQLKAKGSSQAQAFLELSRNEDLTIDEEILNEIKAELVRFFEELREIGAEFGYRSAGEILRFAAVVKKLDPEWKANKIIDAALMQKLLPKIHGSRRKLEPVLKKLAGLCINGDSNIDSLLTKELTEEDEQLIKYPLAFDKIKRMYSNLLNNGFTSYAEA